MAAINAINGNTTPTRRKTKKKVDQKKCLVFFLGVELSGVRICEAVGERFWERGGRDVFLFSLVLVVGDLEVVGTCSMQQHNGGGSF